MSSQRDKTIANGHIGGQNPATSAAKALSPSVVAAAGMLALVFGGCCSNVCCLNQFDLTVLANLSQN